MPVKIPKFRGNGFLEETIYEPDNGMFVFEAKPNELTITMDSFNPEKRRKIIELDVAEVIVIRRPNRLKKKVAKKIPERRFSD